LPGSITTLQRRGLDAPKGVLQGRPAPPAVGWLAEESRIK